MRKTNVPSFIDKTWLMLEEENYEHALRWLPHGGSFEIVDETAFANDVLPHFFKHSNFSSFVRQLNMYNFHKRKTEKGTVQFYHKLFRRQQKQLLIGIRRKPSEAQIMLGEELIRKLAPECLQQNACVQQQEISQKKDMENQEEEVKEEEPFSKEVLSLMSWMGNRANFAECNPKQKIKINIILKNPPCIFDVENRGY